ncbi:MAG: ATP phosphoribosyltransferase regulatory subunit [Tyzzerella sp.]|nr:ATP phosphoribosyltransferase regulatory subunit [Tyzzerella sp.]
MKKQMLHTPEGVRDIYSLEYGKKSVLEEKLQKVFHLYGYHDIQTPTFEYFDVFGKEIGTTSVKELYKFFDREGNTLVLRPDITPSIARAAMTVFDTDNLPIRLCYKGNTFVNQSSYQGRLHENTQAGAELIGIDSVEADAEMVVMAVDSLREVGLKEFQIHIGSVDFFESLIEETGLSSEDEARLRELISNRNYFGVEELLEQAQVKVTTKTALLVLEELIGGGEVLKEAKKVALNHKTIEAVKRLEELYQLLVAYGVDKYITFDLSMRGNYDYYTGIIFRGYTYGTGDAIVKGGRYDHLMEKFGKESPSIGFVIVVDELMNAFARQKLEIPYKLKNTLILYDENRQAEAIKLAKEFRSSGKRTELTKKRSDKSLEEYISYAKQNLCVSMLYLRNTKDIEMVNLLTGTGKSVSKTIT